MVFLSDQKFSTTGSTSSPVPKKHLEMCGAFLFATLLAESSWVLVSGQDATYPAKHGTALHKEDQSSPSAYTRTLKNTVFKL